MEWRVGLVELKLTGEDGRRDFEPVRDVLWNLVAGGVPEAAGWLADGERLEELCERALRLRGGLDGGPERMVMREKARILAHLLKATPEPPRSPSDLLALWDEATRLEPAIRLRITEPRWRTEEDPVPFTTTAQSRVAGSAPLPVPPGKNTADPSEIPALVDGMLAFLVEGDSDPVRTAAHVPQLIGRIHPFVDGNGHTGRMLMCDLLSHAGVGAPTLVSYIGVHHRRAFEWADLMDSVGLGRAGADEPVSFQLEMLQEAQTIAERALRG